MDGRNQLRETCYAKTPIFSTETLYKQLCGTHRPSEEPAVAAAMVQLTELASDPSAVKKLSTEELRAEVERLRSLAAAVQAGATQEARKQQPKSVRNSSSDSAPAADLDEVPEEEEAPAGRV